MQYDFSYTIKRFKKIKIIDCQIANKEDKLLELETMIQKCTSNSSSYNFGGSDFNSIEDRIAKYTDEKDELNKEIKNLRKEYSILVKAFESLTKNEKIVIEEIFLKGSSYNDLCEMLFYSVRQIKRIKLAGLIKLYECLN